MRLSDSALRALLRRGDAAPSGSRWRCCRCRLAANSGPSRAGCSSPPLGPDLRSTLGAPARPVGTGYGYQTALLVNARARGVEHRAVAGTDRRDSCVDGRHCGNERRSLSTTGPRTARPGAVQRSHHHGRVARGAALSRCPARSRRTAGSADRSRRERAPARLFEVDATGLTGKRRITGARFVRLYVVTGIRSQTHPSNLS